MFLCQNKRLCELWNLTLNCAWSWPEQEEIRWSIVLKWTLFTPAQNNTSYSSMVSIIHQELHDKPGTTGIHRNEWLKPNFDCCLLRHTNWQTTNFLGLPWTVRKSISEEVPFLGGWVEISYLDFWEIFMQPLTSLFSIGSCRYSCSQPNNCLLEIKIPQLWFSVENFSFNNTENLQCQHEKSGLQVQFHLQKSHWTGRQHHDWPPLLSKQYNSQLRRGSDEEWNGFYLEIDDDTMRLNVHSGCWISHVYSSLGNVSKYVGVRLQMSCS